MYNIYTRSVEQNREIETHEEINNNSTFFSITQSYSITTYIFTALFLYIARRKLPPVKSFTILAYFIASAGLPSNPLLTSG